MEDQHFTCQCGMKPDGTPYWCCKRHSPDYDITGLTDPDPIVPQKLNPFGIKELTILAYTSIKRDISF